MRKQASAVVISLIIILVLVIIGGIFLLNWAFGSKLIPLQDLDSGRQGICGEEFDKINVDRYSIEEPGKMLIHTEYNDCEGVFDEYNQEREENDLLSWNEFEEVIKTGCIELCDDAGWSDAKTELSSCPRGGYPTCQCDGTYTSPGESSGKEPEMIYEEFESLIKTEVCSEVCQENGFSIYDEEKSGCPKLGHITCYCKRF